MELIRGTHNIRSRHQGCVLTIGNFDGVHLGHQQLIQRVVDDAAKRGIRSGVMFFEPQPREFFSPNQLPSRLTRFRDKVIQLSQYSLDWLLCVAFNQKLRELSAEQFVKNILVEQLQVQHLVVGDDFQFGCDRQGNYEFLLNAGERYGFTVQNSDSVMKADQRVSSTRIRELFEQDQIDAANSLLGWNYSICGRVMHGAELGRTLGVPTANLTLSGLPTALQGVFAVRVELDQQYINGVANLGMKPTVDGAGAQPSLEVHLLDFEGDLYGRHLRVEFLHKLRAIEKFNGLEQLKQQIHQDIAQARVFFN